MGGGKSQTSTQTVAIPPEVLARYNAVNARAEETAKQPFQQYGGEFVAPITAVQQAGIGATSAYSQSAQPYYQAGAGLTLSGARDVGPLTSDQISYYQNPAMLATVAPTLAALQQQQGQQLAQQQTEAIKAGAFGGGRSDMQRNLLRGQQNLATGQAIAPIYQQAYQTALGTAGQQQGVVAQDLARRMQAGQQLAGLGTGAQQAALQGAQAQIGAGTLEQQTRQAQDTAQYQQFLQERGYPFQIAQFLANIAEGTGALSGSTTTTTQPSSFFSDRRLKHDAQKIGETKDGLPIYSFKYNGDDRTQIGLMAQDVEKKHPEAVGMSGGYKTVDYEKALHPSKKAYGGGLDPNSMGGVVSEPGLFARGGYATAGAVVDPTDLSAILQQQRQSFGPWGAAGPYGQAPGAAPHGPSGIVPQQQMHVPKLMTAGAAPKPQDSGFSDLYKGYQQLNSVANDMTGKSLTRRFGEKTGLVPDEAKEKELAGGDMSGTSRYAVASDRNAPASDAPAPPVPLGGSSLARPADLDASSSGGFGDFLSGLNPFKSEGGGVMPREHFDAGGVSVNPYANRDPSEGYIEDTIQEEDKTKTPDMLKPGGGGGGGGGGGLGGDLLKGAQLAKTAFDIGKFFLLKDGGVVPRQHFEDGGDADPVENLWPRLIRQESGGKHFDAKTGQPLTSSAGAVGIAQVMPSTAPEAAKLAGLEYDEDRYRNDPSYNEALGKAYFKDQYRRFGDPQLAAAAYNAGPGAVQKAQQRAQESGQPVMSYLPAETRNYVASIFGESPAVQAIQRASSGRGEGLGVGQEKPGFFDSNKQYILPLLQGLGAMAGSKSRYLGSAILEGLGAGAKAYGDVEAQQAGIEQTRAGTTGTQAQTQAVLAAISKGAGIPRADGTIAAYRVYINGRPTTVSASEFIRALQAGTPYETAPPVGTVGGVSKGAPEFDRSASSVLPPQIPPEQNVAHPIQSGVVIDEQALANARRDAGSPNMTLEQSRKLKSDIDNAAIAAANNRGTINELAGNTSNLIAQGVGGTGSLADARSQVLNVGNTIYKLATGNSLPEGYDGSDLQINRKIASYLAGLQTSSVNQNNANAFMAALEGAPNATLSPKALAAITSLIMVQNDRPQGIQKFADTYGEASAGNFSGNVVSNYDRIHGRQQQAEQHNLADLFVKAPKAAAKIASGEIPYDVAAERLKQLYPKTPDLIRHLQNR